MICEEEQLGTEFVRRQGLQIFEYIEPQTFEGPSIRNQPVPSRYFHRPLSVLLQHFFAHGFVLDGIREPTFERTEDFRGGFEWTDFPPAIVLRVRRLW